MKVLALALCTFTACATGGGTPHSDAPAFLVATQPPHEERIAMQVAPVAMGAPVTEVRQFVTFGADGHVRAVCTVVIRMDGSRLYIPFPDSALVMPSSDRARC